jgi:hypothetical protein
MPPGVIGPLSLNIQSSPYLLNLTSWTGTLTCTMLPNLPSPALILVYTTSTTATLAYGVRSAPIALELRGAPGTSRGGTVFRSPHLAVPHILMLGNNLSVCAPPGITGWSSAGVTINSPGAQVAGTWTAPTQTATLALAPGSSFEGAITATTPLLVTADINTVLQGTISSSANVTMRGIDPSSLFAPAITATGVIKVELVQGQFTGSVTSGGFSVILANSVPLGRVLALPASVW